MKTKIVKFSTRIINTLQTDIEFAEFRDPRYPLRLRFHKSREKASWYFVQSIKGKNYWKKIANWPLLSFDDIKASLSAYQIKFNLNPEAVMHNSYPTVALLAAWYLKRSTTNSSITTLRKTTIKWAITCHIIPLIGALKITEINRERLENQFFWPLQENLQNSTVRSVWNVLKQLFTQAMFLKIIEPNELVGLQFSHFVKEKIMPEPTRLRSNQLGEAHKNAQHTSIPTQLLFILMLAHGTRIGETRQLKWSYFCFESKELNIPGCITKNRDELTIPLTNYIIDLLKQYQKYQNKKHYQGVYLFRNVRSRTAIHRSTANDMIQEVSLDNWTSRSLRKVFRSSLLELGVDSEVAEMMLNHRRSTLSDTYIHTTAPKLKRKALNKYHEWLLELHPRILSFSAS